MKLIIDIPEVDYNYVKQQVADGNTNPLKRFIGTGTPLDKIKAEIERKMELKSNRSVLITNTYMDCLQIIDKYLENC